MTGCPVPLNQKLVGWNPDICPPAVLNNWTCPPVVVQLLIHVRLCDPMDDSMPAPCPSPSPRICSNPCPLSQWCHTTISSSVIPFSSCLYSFPASGTFPMSWLFTSGGQSIGDLAWVLSKNIHCWFPLGLILLLSQGLSRDFSCTTVWKHEFFGAPPSLWSNSCIHIWLWIVDISPSSLNSSL